jgi:hypothetical protein
MTAMLPAHPREDPTLRPSAFGVILSVRPDTIGRAAG